MGDKEDWDVDDVEDYRTNRDEGFSHSLLVMSAMRKCLESGCKEMRTGWMNEKVDREGNVNRIYIEDTRKLFIESVETCIMFMCCDYDSDAKANIKKIFDSIDTERKKLSKLNDTAWEKLNEYERETYSKNGNMHITGKITHKRLIEEMIVFELKAYRKIFSELSKLTERKGFYKEETING